MIVMLKRETSEVDKITASRKELKTKKIKTTPTKPGSSHPIDLLKFNCSRISSFHHAGADVNITNEWKTALFYAVQQRNNEIVVRALIDDGADVNSTDNEGKPALFYAVQRSNNERVVRALIIAGADVNSTDNEGKPALFYAVQRSNNESVVGALIDAGADVNRTDNEGKPALFYAVQLRNNKRLVRALIDAGADVNRTDNEGKTALFYAVQRSNNESMVRALINAGADVNSTDNEGKPALFYAVQRSNNESVVRALIDAGADVNRTDNEGKTALFYAVQQRNNESMVRAVINAGADVNITDNEGKPALFYAVQQSKNIRVVRALIDAGADANITDNEGKTALFFAVQQSNNESVVRALIECPMINVNARDDSGRTPLFYAVTNSLELAKLLIARGANLHWKDSCDVSILSFLIHNCILNKYDDCLHSMTETLALLMEQGVKRKTVFKTIINVVFSQMFRNLVTYRGEIMKSLCEVLESATNYVREENKQESRFFINEIMQQMRYGKTYRIGGALILNILELLIKLGANPNSADCDGNTTMHFLAQLSMLIQSQETIHNILTKLETSKRLENIRKLQNHQHETPFSHMFSLSSADGSDQLPNITVVKSICEFLLKHGSSVEETSRTGRTAFHWIVELIRQVLLTCDSPERKGALTALMQMFELFASQNITKGVTVNQKDARDSLNTPLHLWASLQLGPGQDYSSSIADGNTLESILSKLLEFFLKSGAQLSSKNENDETPLHLCTTWTAFKLLVDAGANPNTLDSTGCPPLLAAARKKTFAKDCKYFYPDVVLKPKEVWENILKYDLKPWFVDENGDSVLSILIKSEALDLAKALVEVACEKTLDQKETILTSILNAICKDESLVSTWKSDLVERILKSQGGTNFKPHEASPLHFCCRNIVSLDKEKSLHHHARPKVSKSQKEHSYKKAKIEHSTSTKSEGINPLDMDNVHWTIAKLLLQYGPDCTIPDATGQSCLDIARDCPPLEDLLKGESPYFIPWISISKKHRSKLSKVAILQECCHVDQFRYHKDHLACGSFGAVYAGINEKDGREVAIKRIEKVRMQRPEDKQEITNLILLTECEQVVQYFMFFEDTSFCYIIFELMEGNLDEYLDGHVDAEKSVKLCQDVVQGLNFLHSHKILHQDLKPSNILYKCHPKICLKIAGLSRCIDFTSTTVDWIAPEVLMSRRAHSKSSNVFGCGLVLHYILSVKKYPFASRIGAVQHETEVNILNGNMEGWDDSLCPEATHLVKGMLDGDKSKRPSADKALDHPFFWSKKKKLDLLVAVGNQPEFEYPRAKRPVPLTVVETDLETSFGTIVKYGDWNDPGYVHMSTIYTEMTKKRKGYDTHSVVELVQFIRNALTHVNESTQPTLIRKQLLEDFVFLEYFPNLVMEVYKAVTTHGWDQTREEIKYAMKK